MGQLLKIVEQGGNRSVSLQVMQQTLARQRERQQELAESNNLQRWQRLEQLKKLLKTHRKALTQAVNADLKTHTAEVGVVEWAAIWQAFNQAKLLTQHWAYRPRFGRFKATQPQFRHLSKGCVLILTSWHQPLAQPLVHIIAALAAGNSVVLKPSHKTPHTSRILADLIESHVDNADIAVFLGGGDVGQTLLSLPFDYVHACGNSASLRHIQGQWHQKPEQIHLQEHSFICSIVDDSADPEKAAMQIAWSRYRYSGQTDAGPHVVYVQKGLRHRFIKELKRSAGDLYGETLGRQRYNKAYARLRDEPHFECVRQALIKTQQQGGYCAVGGHVFQRDLFIAPTVVILSKPKNILLSHPYAGPILPTLPYSDDQHLSQLLKQLGHQHTVCIFSRKPEHLLKTLGNHADKVLINPSLSQSASNLISPLEVLLHRFSLAQPIERTQKHWLEPLRPPWQDRKLAWLMRWLRRLSS